MAFGHCFPWLDVALLGSIVALVIWKNQLVYKALQV